MLLLLTMCFLLKKQRVDTTHHQLFWVRLLLHFPRGTLSVLPAFGNGEVSSCYPLTEMLLFSAALSQGFPKSTTAPSITLLASSIPTYLLVWMQSQCQPPAQRGGHELTIRGLMKQVATAAAFPTLLSCHIHDATVFHGLSSRAFQRIPTRSPKTRSSDANDPDHRTLLSAERRIWITSFSHFCLTGIHIKRIRWLLLGSFGTSYHKISTEKKYSRKKLAVEMKNGEGKCIAPANISTCSLSRTKLLVEYEAQKQGILITESHVKVTDNLLPFVLPHPLSQWNETLPYHSTDMGDIMTGTN